MRARHLTLGLFVIASTAGGCTRSYAGRWIVWNWSGIEDHRRFPSRPVQPAPDAFHFASPERAASMEIEVERKRRIVRMNLDELGRSTGTTALIVIRADTILFEGYFNGHDRASINTSFSVAKSITSLLVGSAIDEGWIRSVHDPVTRYLPELAARDERFTRLTIAHLLDMRSGLRWRDHDFLTGDKPRAYYHPHLRSVVLQEIGFTDEPDQRWVYNSYNPILLGLVLERSTGRSPSQLLEERIWKRIGTEFPASWSTDGDREPIEKMESGVNARAIDFAKLGRLVLRRGAWEDEQIVSREWIEESTRAEPGCELPALRPRAICYHRAWWLYPDDGSGTPAIGANGHLGQYIFIFPRQALVIVRFGRKQGGVSWPAVFRSIAAAIEREGSGS